MYCRKKYRSDHACGTEGNDHVIYLRGSSCQNLWITWCNFSPTTQWCEWDNIIILILWSDQLLFDPFIIFVSRVAYDVVKRLTIEGLNAPPCAPLYIDCTGNWHSSYSDFWIQAGSGDAVASVAWLGDGWKIVFIFSRYFGLIYVTVVVFFFFFFFTEILDTSFHWG